MKKSACFVCTNRLGTIKMPNGGLACEQCCRSRQEAHVAPPSAVDHPPHYNAHPSGVECVDIAEHYNFNVGNAIKYVWRAGLKGDAIEDLKKARWYLDREIARREKASK